MESIKNQLENTLDKFNYEGLKDPYKGKKAFQQRWDGAFGFQGERVTAEMKLCFGVNCEASYFINNEIFKHAFSRLYDPLISAISL